MGGYKSRRFPAESAFLSAGQEKSSGPAGESASQPPLPLAGRRGASPRASQSRPQLGRRAHHLAGCGTRAARRRSGLFAAHCVHLSQHTPRLSFKCVARSQQGPGRVGGALPERRGRGLAPPWGAAAHSPPLGVCPCPPHSPWHVPDFSSDGPQPVQMSLPLTRDGSPLCQAWLSSCTYGLAHGAVF